MTFPAAIVLLASLLIFKHFLADGPFQTSYQLSHKGEFLHPGGLIHAGIHVALTAACIAFCMGFYLPTTDWLRIIPGTLGTAAAMEFVIHYSIDWLKCHFEKMGHWSEAVIAQDGERQLIIKSDMFFHAFLADQMMHSLTYIALVYLVASRL